MFGFSRGDRVEVAHDRAGMIKGEPATVIDFLEGPGMIVISMWEYDGVYNMLPEDLIHRNER